MQEKLYEVYRFYQDSRRPQLMKSNLTRKQAMEWCSDPETSSHTAKNACDGDDRKIERWNEKQKHWFDGFEEQ